VSVEEKVKTLQNLTETTGSIHEWQQMQLTSWAGAVFEKHKPWEASIDIENKLLSFSISHKKPLDPKRVAMMVVSTRWLLGPEWSLSIFDQNGLQLFDSSNNLSNVSARNAKRKQRNSNSKGKGSSK
jgi:hypothetical protein